jgi:hypothetical protein
VTVESGRRLGKCELHSNGSCSTLSQLKVSRKLKARIGNVPRLTCLRGWAKLWYKWQAVNKLQHQPWGQQLLAAAERLGVTLSLPPVPPVARAARAPRAPPVVLNPAVPHVVVNRGALQQRAAAGPAAAAAAAAALPVGAPAPCGLSARGVVLLQADLLGDRTFTEVRYGDVVPANVTLRLVLPGVVPPVRYVEGVTCWQLPLGARADDVFLTWSPALKTACYAALKRRGNACRQAIVRHFLDAQVADHTRLRRWASSLSCSFQQPYWRLADVRAARRLLRLRLDLLPNEDQMRWRPHTRSQLRLPRIPVAAQRACYLCPCIDGADGVYWPETLEHVLLKCTCPQLVALRVAVRSELRDIAADPDAVDLARAAGAAVPQFDDDTQLYTVLRLCVGVGPVSALQAVPVAVAAPEVRRASPQFAYCADSARRAAAWVAALTDDWVDIHRNAHRSGLSSAPGGRLAMCVARHAVRVFCARRAALELVDGFQTRSRDPPDLLFRTHQAPVASLEPVVSVRQGDDSLDDG